jgi:hypothetical protein
VAAGPPGSPRPSPRPEGTPARHPVAGFRLRMVTGGFILPVIGRLVSLLVFATCPGCLVAVAVTHRPAPERP